MQHVATQVDAGVSQAEQATATSAEDLRNEVTTLNTILARFKVAA